MCSLKLVLLPALCIISDWCCVCSDDVTQAIADWLRENPWHFLGKFPTNHRPLS